jgi:hypothetical protein
LPFADGSLAVVQSGQNTYILGGSADLIMVPSFAAANPSWKAVYSYNTPLDQVRVAPGAAVLADGTIMIFGGQGGEGDPLNSVYDFYGNPTVPASMNSARYDFGYATDENHNVYAIGGRGDGVSSSVESFNQAANTWTELAQLPQGLSGLSAVGDDAGHIFAIGGVEGNGILSAAVYRYTVATNTWDTVASLPAATGNSAAVLGSNGLIYVFGGITAAGTTAAVESYNESTNTWTVETPLPAPVSSEGATTDSLGRIVVAGGFDASGLATANVYVSQQLNQLDSVPVITTTTASPATVNSAYSLQVLSTGNPQPTYTLTAAPTGMTINPSTGLVSWTPNSDQAGYQTYTVQASNYAGNALQTYTIPVIGEAPAGVTATGSSTSSINVSWNASADSGGVTYNVYEAIYHPVYHGRSYYTYKLIGSGIAGTSYLVTGLATGSTHTYVVTDVGDVTGLESARSAMAAGQSWYAPTLSTEFLLGSGAVWQGAAPVTSGQSVQITLLWTGNPTPDFTITSAPPGTILVDASGHVSYTPAPGVLGVVNYTVQASNPVGTATQTYQFDVLPAPTIIFNDGPFTFNGYAFYATATAVGTDGVTSVPGTFEFFYSGPSNPPSFAGTYTVTAYFTSGVSNYGSTVATSTMIINPAPAVFGDLVSPTIPDGTPTVTLSGNLTDGQLAPASGSVDVTLNGVTQAVPLGAGDTFAATFDTSALPPGSYAVAYAYVPGDTDFTAQNGSSTVTVTTSVQTTPTIIWATPTPITYGTPLSAAQLDATAVDPNTNAPLAGAFSYSPVAGTILDAGTQTLNVTFVPADTTDYTSASGSATIVVNGAPTTTTLASSSSTSVYGEPITFTATVTSSVPATGTPAGTITFIDGSTVLGSQSLDLYGTATLTTSALPKGSNNITAVYGGGFDLSTSTSASLAQTVTQAATTTTVAAPAATSVYGQTLTFTSTVSPVAPGAGTPTGAVKFKDGTTTLATVAVAADGTATFTTSALVIGSHSITAAYGGDSNFTASTSAVSTQTVIPDASTTTLASSASSAVFGETVTLTATVAAASPGSGLPTGKVTFLDGTVTLGTATLANGVATLKTSALTIGSHSLTAVYGGDSHFASGTSVVLTQTINRGASVAKVTSSADPSVFGQKVTFTAVVSAVAPGAGTPTGTVVFYSGAAMLGSSTLSGGKATFSSTTLAPGNYSVTASYGGDGNFTGGTTAVLTQTVNQDATTAKVTSSKNPSVFGQGVTFTATVAAAAPGTGTPTGTLELLDGSTVLDTATLASGKASFSATALAVGGHPITVIYSGDGNFAGNTSAVLSQAVNQATSASKVTSSVATSVYGQTVTFTAVVTAVSPGAGTPTGSVTFLDGSTTLGSGTLSGGKATYATSTLAVGSHSIAISYSGDANFAGGTSPVSTQTVNEDASVVAVTSTVNPSVFGQTITLTATVTAKPPGTGTPTGPVSFLDGGTVLYTTALSGGTATYTTSSLSVGSHSITVQYTGDGNFSAGKSSARSEVVNQAATRTALSSSLNPSTSGQSITFTAIVSVTSPGAGIPAGSVTFKSGSTTLATVPPDATGTATFTISTLSVGSDAITASYAATTNHKASNSATLTEVINSAPAALAIADGTLRALASAAGTTRSAAFPVPVGGVAQSAEFSSNVAGTVARETVGGSESVQPRVAILDRLFAEFGEEEFVLSRRDESGTV